MSYLGFVLQQIVNSGTHNSFKDANYASLCGANYYTRGRSHHDLMHWPHQQILVSQKQEDGLGNPYGSSQTIRHNRPRPAKNLERGAIEGNL